MRRRVASAGPETAEIATPPEIVITGDSHCGAIAWALDARAESDPALRCRALANPFGSGKHLDRPFFEASGGRLTITSPEYSTAFSEFPPLQFGNAGQDIMYVFCMGLHSSRVWRRVGITRYVPQRLFKPGHGIPLSPGLLTRVIDRDTHYIREFLAALKARKLNLLVVEAPRLFRHHPALAKISRNVVFEIDHIYRERMKTWLRNEGIGLVEIPVDCLDEEGFMRPEFRSDREGDPHHGNVAFGGIMLDRILGAVPRAGAVASLSESTNDLSDMGDRSVKNAAELPIHRSNSR